MDQRSVSTDIKSGSQLITLTILSQSGLDIFRNMLKKPLTFSYICSCFLAARLTMKRPKPIPFDEEGSAHERVEIARFDLRSRFNVKPAAGHSQNAEPRSGKTAEITQKEG